MKRTLAPALLSLAIFGFGGCGQSDTPNTNGNCNGLVTVGLNASGGVNGFKNLDLTDLSPTGQRYTQSASPPLPLPNVVLRISDKFVPGQHLFRVVASDKSPSQASAAGPTDIAAIGRLSIDLEGKCPTTQVSLAPVRLTDSCLDKCDAQLRCGQMAFAQFTSCQSECNVKDAQFARQQDGWVADWSTFYAPDPKNHAMPDADAAATVTQRVGQLDSCNFAACGEIETCGAGVIQSLTPSPQP